MAATGNATVAHTAPVVRAKRALALGLHTLADVEREFQAAREGWSRGTEYECPFCDTVLTSPSGARKHMAARGHPVLRMDWYDWLPARLSGKSG